jgi:acyl carrier protein
VATGDGSLGRNFGPDERTAQRACAPTEAPSRTGELVIGILREKFGVPRVDLQQHFVDLGGDSYTATQLMARVSEELGMDLSPILPFESSTLNEMIARIDAIRETVCR